MLHNDHVELWMTCYTMISSCAPSLTHTVYLFIYSFLHDMLHDDHQLRTLSHVHTSTCGCLWIFPLLGTPSASMHTASLFILQFIHSSTTRAHMQAPLASPPPPAPLTYAHHPYQVIYFFSSQICFCSWNDQNREIMLALCVCLWFPAATCRADASGFSSPTIPSNTYAS